MTKGMAKKQALRWLDEATLNGSDASAELTADYIDKFNYFLYNVLVYIASFFKLSRNISIDKDTAYEQRGYFRKYGLPEDFMELEKVILTDNKAYGEIFNYSFEGQYSILIPEEYFKDNAKLTVFYFGRPKKVDVAALDTTELEVMPIAEQLVPLRLAIEATAGSDETSAISAYLEGKFGNMLENLLGDKQGAPNMLVERVYAQ